MGQRLATRGNFSPKVSFDKEKQYFVGTYLSKRSFEHSFGSDKKQIPVYTFEILDGDAPVTTKEGKELREVNVKQHDKVEVVGGTRLIYALDQLQAGQTVRIVYLGEGARPARGGNRPKEYEVTLLTQEEVNALN